MIWTIVRRVIFFIILTVLTQVGGVIFLFSLLIYYPTEKLTENKWYRRLLKLGGFIFLYLLSTFLIIPPLAKMGGRVQMPLREKNFVRPATVFSFLLNRNYVRPALRSTVEDAAKELQEKYPGTVVHYLDAGFPFLNGFPLLPHLSHNDGRKIDLNFIYSDKVFKKISNELPTFSGYGAFNDPQAGEENVAEQCKDKGYWQYGIAKFTRFSTVDDELETAISPTSDLIRILSGKNDVQKIFIEPHLKKRWGLQKIDKIRFHGCQAVRHDDHIHVQVH